MTGPRKGMASPGKAAARRQRYMELRRQGADPWTAATEVGIDPFRGAARYERWFQVAERGQAEATPPKRRIYP